MVDAGVEKHVLHQVARQGWLTQHVGQPAVAAPVIGHGPAAVRNDQAQFRKVAEQIALQQLHEGRCVGVEVVRAGGVEAGIAGPGDVDHRRHIEFDHLLKKGIPGAVGQRRRGPVSSRGVGVEVAADEAQFVDATLQLMDRVRYGHARRLRQLANAEEVLRKHRNDPRDQIVGCASPGLTDALVADVVAHAGGTRRKDRHVDATLLQQPKLVAFDRRENLVVADARVEGGSARPILGILDLCFSKGVMQLRFGRVVAVAVDNHGRSLHLWSAIRLIFAVRRSGSRAD
ncbi:hypothetical protein D3C85_665920 [compost metagenome]